MCRRFEIINPTSSGYEFRWSDDSSLTYGAPFKCITLRGYVEGGKKYEVQYVWRDWLIPIIRVCCWAYLIYCPKGSPQAVSEGPSLPFPYRSLDAVVGGDKNPLIIPYNPYTSLIIFYQEHCAHCLSKFTCS